MTVRLLAIDVDGTLANSKGNVSDYTRRVLHAAVERGIYVVISTGRSRAFLQCVSEQVGINQPIICNNGAEIWKNCDELLKQRFHHFLILKAIFSNRKLQVQVGHSHSRNLVPNPSVTVGAAGFYRERGCRNRQVA